MRAYVFTDEALARHAGRFVWLSIDIEKETNAAFRTKYPVPAIPTYLIIDPRSETPVMRFVGGTNVEGLVRLFDEAELAYRGGENPLLARADSLYGAGTFAAAADVYAEVLATLEPASPSYARTVESQMFALQMADRNEQGAQLATGTLPQLGRTASAGIVAAGGLDCALALPSDHPKRREWMAEFERVTLDIVSDRTVKLHGDDRSGMYIALLNAREAAGDAKGQRMIAEQWSALLDAEAEAAPTPEARTVYDSHRLSAYIELGEPARALPMLERSAQDFPDDYNPYARLAVAYKYLERWDEGIEASEKALERAYGPRKLRIYNTLVDLYEGKGDVDRAKSVLEDAIAYGEALPEGQRSDRRVAPFKKRLSELS